MNPTIQKTKKLVIFGTEDLADIAHEYFQHDSEYDVVAFTAGKAYITENQKNGLPLVPFEEVEKHYPPSEYDIFVAIVYGDLNAIRADVVEQAKNKQYTLATYISSRTFVWHYVEIGENCFVFEDNTIQPFVKIKDNVILWSGNHIGHHSVIDSHCFITSHVVVSGWCNIGKFCFIGVNTTLANNTTIGDECWVSHGTIVSGEVPPLSMIKTVKSEFVPLDKKALFRSLRRHSDSRR